MADSQRHKTSELINWLQKNISKIEILQVLRLLKQAKYKDPELKIEIRSSNHLHFPEKNIDGLFYDIGENRLLISVNYVGLVGPAGVLPSYYSILLMQHRRLKNVLLDKLIVNIQSKSILYYHEAWEKSKIYLHYQNQRLGHSQTDYIRSLLNSLVGIQEPSDYSFRSDYSLAYFPRFARRARTCEDLEQLLSVYLNFKVTIEEFFPKKIYLSFAESSFLADTQAEQSASTALLGNNFTLGSYVRISAYHFRINITINNAQQNFFIKNRKLLKSQIQLLARAFIGNYCEYSINFIFQGKAVYYLSENFSLL